MSGIGSTDQSSDRRIRVITSIVGLALIVCLVGYVAFTDRNQAATLQIELSQAAMSQDSSGVLVSSVTVTNHGGEEFQLSGHIDGLFFPKYTFEPATLPPGRTSVGQTRAAWNVSQFDGLNGHISVPNSPSINPSVFTLEIGFEYQSLDQDPQMIVGKGSAGGDSFYFYTFRSANNINDFVIFRNNTRFDHSLGDIFAPNKWYTVAFTVDGTEISAFVNGKLANRWNNAITFSGNSNDLIIGKCGCGGYSFNGSFAFARLYNRALTGSEVQGNLDHQNVSQLGLVMSLSSNRTLGSVFIDQSGSGNNGQASAGVSVTTFKATCDYYLVIVNAVGSNGREVDVSKLLKLGC